MLNKKALRRLYRLKREALSPKDLESASTQIMAHVISHNLMKRGLLMLFFDSAAHAELPMKKWFDTFKEHPICVPKVVDANGKMEAVIWHKGVPLMPNQWGVPEPSGTDYINPKNIATIVVPLLCFDQNGHRVGYGKGYYDKFLSRCSPTCKTIGISCFDPIEKIEDATETDVALQMVITPQKIYSF